MKCECCGKIITDDEAVDLFYSHPGDLFDLPDLPAQIKEFKKNNSVLRCPVCLKDR